ncbi:MAG TPA: response regulator transcription factor [Candidatus Eisenbergiella merdipullorum]|uniref:Stage 0 sporulation protein A homolog n=1 Tax=Candidatus Eisenbergiella merdipullorum TaxID=2838553 RepID=A0A9D2I6P5_9FIRM|nr:response regulator transcription factor [Candidatus Eisenbergiella merdipullorum]
MDRNNGKILIADDDREILDVLRMLLEEEGYQVIAVQNGEEVLKQADDSVELYILDVNMPLISGFAAGAELRKRTFAPIIFLTAYSGESDKTIGFSAGADDYIVKPFSNGELLLRVKALLRRVRTYTPAVKQPPLQEEGQGKIRYQDLVLDTDSQSVSRNGEMIGLTVTEYQILELLLTHRRKIFSLENIYQSIWKEEAVGDAAIMVHIKNIRKKLGDSSRTPRYIKTAWGKGYYAD